MKALKVFVVFSLAHLVGWAGSHYYLSENQPQILIVVDTSFAMKPKFPEMNHWIEEMAKDSRYKAILVGTDKAYLGKLSDLKANSIIFRTSFGKMSEDNLKRYTSTSASEKILLSNGEIAPSGWQVIVF